MSADLRCPTPVQVGDLRVDQILPTLSSSQATYATYLTLATWAGFPLLASQSSREAIGIHNFLSAFLTTFPLSSLTSALSDPSSPVFLLIEFAATFYQNGSNYTGFGDAKFVPRVSKEALVELVSPYPAVTELLTAVIDALYADDPGVRTLGWYPTGATSYYNPSDFEQAEQEAIDALLTERRIRKENTIVFREAERYAVKRVCAEVDEQGTEIGVVRNLPVFVTKGLYSDVVKKMIGWLNLVRDSALNDRQKEMFGWLIKHFETGEVGDHVKYSELWVQDIDPPVEHYYGFIESYRDPSGVRCEFENFVAAVNPHDSEFLHRFVSASTTILPLLPYPPVYERNNFNPPSYNAIDLLSIATSYVPIGINVPNYDEIRNSIGFKNVTLANVVAAIPPSAAQYPFLTDDIIPTFIRYFRATRTLNVAIHELYGHGSGRLFSAADVARGDIPDLLTPGKFVKTFYKEGETYQEAFGSLQASYEECRAETTSLHLGLKDEVLEMFGVAPEDRRDFRVCFVLNLLHYGLMTLPVYSPTTRVWKQAHAQARFVIIRALLIWGRGAVSVKKVEGKFKLFLNADLFDGIEDAVERLLVHLNYYKATRLVDPAREFYGALSSFDDFWLEVRSSAEAVYIPRPCYLGARVVKDGDKYSLGKITDGEPTVLDVALTAVENIKLALE
jgi:dipeptidyl-peptidase-3